MESSTWLLMCISKDLSYTICACFVFLPLMLAASVVVSTMLIIAPTHSLQLLVYVYFVVATMPHLLEASASYHVYYLKRQFLST